MSMTLVRVSPSQIWKKKLKEGGETNLKLRPADGTRYERLNET